MKISIIIPVYNEANKIARDIYEANEFLLGQGLTGEIIVVDDGSWDNTIRVAKETGATIETSLHVIEYIHKGKGHSVKTGILKAQSDIVVFIDSGSCIPYNNLLRGLKLIEDNECDIAHGSRLLKESEVRGKSKIRQFSSWIFRKIVFAWMKIPEPLTDTQCGLKIYRREVALALYRACISDSFMFDIEIILRADKAGYRIKEFPIEWTSDPDSRLSIFKNFQQIVRELRKIKNAL